MIKLVITDAKKKRDVTGAWFVFHPCNDSILAYCGTEEEADIVINSFNKLSRVVDDNYDYAVVDAGGNLRYNCDDSYGPAKDKVDEYLSLLLRDTNPAIRNTHIRILTVHKEYKNGKIVR